MQKAVTLICGLGPYQLARVLNAFVRLNFSDEIDGGDQQGGGGGSSSSSNNTISNNGNGNGNKGPSSSDGAQAASAGGRYVQVGARKHKLIRRGLNTNYQKSIVVLSIVLRV